MPHKSVSGCSTGFRASSTSRRRGSPGAARAPCSPRQVIRASYNSQMPGTGPGRFGGDGRGFLRTAAAECAKQENWPARRQQQSWHASPLSRTGLVQCRPTACTDSHSHRSGLAREAKPACRDRVRGSKVTRSLAPFGLSRLQGQAGKSWQWQANYAGHFIYGLPGVPGAHGASLLMPVVQRSSRLKELTIAPLNSGPLDPSSAGAGSRIESPERLRRLTAMRPRRSPGPRTAPASHRSGASIAPELSCNRCGDISQHQRKAAIRRSCRFSRARRMEKVLPGPWSRRKARLELWISSLSLQQTDANSCAVGWTCGW